MTEPMSALDTLLPHRPPMILLDEVLASDEASLVATVTIRPTSLFLEAEGIPGHVGLEYMAQACGAFAGIEALRKREAVRIGFLLGTRRYIMHAPWFRLDERLTVSVSLGYRDEAMANFDGRIEIAGKLVAEGRLTVYQPQDAVGNIGFEL
jgi:predicted hotdog family 3-hydroxylacyl-ACP dehydratase